MRTAILLSLAIASADEKPRVYVTDSQAWEISGGFALKSGTGGGSIRGGSRPQTVEVIKNLTEKCPAVAVTMDRSRAQYIVLFDREGGKGYARKDNKIAIFRKDGDLVMSKSTRTVGNAVKDACEAMR